MAFSCLCGMVIMSMQMFEEYEQVIMLASCAPIKTTGNFPNDRGRIRGSAAHSLRPYCQKQPPPLGSGCFCLLNCLTLRKHQ
jgi:hypothetical protein